ncbi:MAG: hypothetical protein IPN19_07745 [Elusimicrobia bacterium]|nr:hypothetical protein [Elusimicrobiota bacterium]
MLGTLLRQAGGIIRSEIVPGILSVSKPKARSLLHRWAAQHWIVRLKRGIYLPLPLEAESSDRWAEDPWVIANAIFSPCYIGGWSAGEHWGLTEQIFREVIVYTSNLPRKGKQEILSTPFLLKRTSTKRLFGTVPVWRGQNKIQVADPSRTLVDVFNDPSVAGGFSQAVRLLRAYLASDHRDLNKLLHYLVLFDVGALFKRFGYLFNILAPQETVFIAECRQRIGKGYSKLDPSAMSKGPHVRAWNLRINQTVTIDPLH